MMTPFKIFMTVKSIETIDSPMYSHEYVKVNCQEQIDFEQSITFLALAENVPRVGSLVTITIEEGMQK